MQIYRRAREFFDQPSIKFLAGISLVKTNERAGKSLEPEPNVEDASGVQAREIALEDFLLNRAKNFFTERKRIVPFGRITCESEQITNIERKKK